MVEAMAPCAPSPATEAFCKNPYNFIDFAALIPLGVRSAYGLTTPAAADNLIAHTRLILISLNVLSA